MNCKAIPTRHRIVTALAAASLAATTVPAQEQSLEDLVDQHQAKLAKTATDPGAYEKAVAAYKKALSGHLKTANDKERAETRFALTSLLMFTGQPDEAKATLAAFDTKRASGVDCANAAVMASELRMKDRRASWLNLALEKKGTLTQRMEVGMIVLTALHEVKRAEALFATELAKAKGKEQKAEVAWYIAWATREREDLPEGAYERALEALAKDHPGTRYGQIAADRIRAMDFKVGGDPIPLTLPLLGGGRFVTADQKDKVVLLAFLADEVRDSANAARAFQELHSQYGGAGLQVVGIWLDESRQVVTKAIERLHLSFPQSWQKGGFDSDLALRLRVEDAPQCLLIGRDGKIAGMNFLVGNERGQRRLIDAVRKAVGK